MCKILILCRTSIVYTPTPDKSSDDQRVYQCTEGNLYVHFAERDTCEKLYRLKKWLEAQEC